MWEKITEAQTRRQNQTAFNENGQEVQIRIEQNGWYEGYVSFS
jgi:hypothetical protein